MLMTVLKGELAVNQSKALIRTFKAMNMCCGTVSRLNLIWNILQFMQKQKN